MALITVGWVCAGPWAWLSTHPCHGKDRALSASARQMMTPCGTRLPAIQWPFSAEIIVVLHSVAGWAQSSVGTFLLPAQSINSPALAPRPCCAPDGNHGALIWQQQRQDQTAEEEWGWQIRHMDALPREAHNHRHCSLGKGISICTWPLGFLTPAALTTGAWNAASWRSSALLILSFIGSSRKAMWPSFWTGNRNSAIYWQVGICSWRESVRLLWLWHVKCHHNPHFIFWDERVGA